MNVCIEISDFGLNVEIRENILLYPTIPIGFEILQRALVFTM